MTFLVVITSASDTTFIQQFPDAVLENKDNPDIHIWTFKDIEDQEANKIQNYRRIIGSHFITL